jgi:hypothetical protein
MPSAAYFHREAETWWSLAKTDGDPFASRRYRAMALDCIAKAHELGIDELQSRVMPISEDWHPATNSGTRTKAASVGGFVARGYHDAWNAQSPEEPS